MNKIRALFSFLMTASFALGPIHCLAEGPHSSGSEPQHHSEHASHEHSSHDHGHDSGDNHDQPHDDDSCCAPISLASLYYLTGRNVVEDLGKALNSGDASVTKISLPFIKDSPLLFTAGVGPPGNIITSVFISSLNIAPNAPPAFI